MSDQYYRFFPGDYLRDTQGLSLTENGAYRMLLDSYYSQEYLPDDIQELYMICRAFKDFEQKAVQKVVEKYFKANGNGHLLNRKAEKEIAGRRAYFEEQGRKAKLGADARWKDHIKENARGDANGHAPGMPERCPNDAPPSPSPSPSKRKVKTLCSSNDELFGAFWNSYPKKKSKGKALSAWKNLKEPTSTLNLILKALEWQKNSEQWIKENGQFIPYPASYLNARAWEDEPDGNKKTRSAVDEGLARFLASEDEPGRD